MAGSYARYSGLGGGGGGGGITSLSVATANGFAGTVSSGSTPTITLSTTVTGLLYGNGTSLSAQTVGNLTEATSSVLTISGGTGAILGSGLTIQVKQASTSQSGYLSSTDWNTFNGKQASGSYITALTGDGTASGPGSAALTLATVNTNIGSFSPAAITVNGKGLVTAASAVTTGNLTELTSSVLAITGGTSAVLGSGASIQVKQASGSQSGYLSSTDWTTFNGKGAGSVTSVAASVPSVLSISGSPITSSGTLTIGYSGTALPIANGGTAVTSVTTAPAATAFAGWDANKNLSSNNLIEGYATTATAAGTTVLTVSSAYQQFFTGTTTQTLTLPVASTLVTGMSFLVTNLSTGIVTVQSSGANTILAQAPGTSAIYTCILAIGTTAASWNSTYVGNGGAVAPTGVTLSGSGTFTTPANASFLIVTVAGGGGGGGGSGTGTPGNGGAGGNSTFGTSLLTANGGGGGVLTSASPSVGGSVTVNSPASPLFTFTGGSGAQGSFNGSVSGNAVQEGGIGGSNPLGGAGAPVYEGPGGNAISGSGAGAAGGGAGNATSQYSGGGGSAGGYLQALITPTAGQTFSYSVGASGTAGTAGGSGSAGGVGGSGSIVVTIYYNNGAVGTATGITGSVNSSQVLGTTAGGSAPSGYIGEFFSANSAGVSWGTSGNLVNIASISLTAGDWDVEATAQLVTGATSAASLYITSISTSSGAQDSTNNGGVAADAFTLTQNFNYYAPMSVRRINVSGNQTVYLVGQVNYTVLGGGTWGTGSILSARRVR